MAVEAQDLTKETSFTKELKYGFGEYSRYVISDRALPDARDGLKPVHRRIIWAMQDMGLTHRSNYKKCARIVGEVTGKYHPHAGGTYESVVRLAQDWSLRYPLVDGQGNFGSIDGYPPAAMRYTEARLAKISQELTANISKNVVEFVENFDGEEFEPTVLPVKVPHLLLNGAKGIAVGMSSNIPPHQLGELIDGCIAIIDNPRISVLELMQYVKGPDFPTGGLIIGMKGVEDLYMTGKGSIRVRSRVHFESPDTHKVKNNLLVVTEIPYFVNKTTLIEEIATLINDKKIRGISNVRDLSKDKIRIEIEVETGFEDEEALRTIQAQLFKRTSLQTLFHARILAFVWGKPRTLNLKQSLSIFLDFREKVVKNIAIEELEKVEARIHILEGLIIATDHIDEVISTIRSSENRKDAQNKLMSNFGLSELQSKAVLDMSLGRLTRIESGEIQKEAAEKRKRAEELRLVIHDRPHRLQLMKDQLLEVKNKFNDKRRTDFVYQDIYVGTTDRQFIHERKLLVSSTSEGYVRSIELEKFNTQKRGGRGVAGVPLNEEEKLFDLQIVSNKDDLLLITERGVIHKIPAYEVPEVAKRTRKGRKLSTLIPVESNIVKIVPIEEDGFSADKVFVTVTKNGIVKRTSLDKYKNIRKNGIRCLKFKEEDDRVADAFITEGQNYIFLASKKGKAVVFKDELARLVGRSSMGVIAMKLEDEDDEIVSAFPISYEDYDDTSIFTITEKGYGKRTKLSDYRITNRGAKGVKNIKVTSKNGLVISSMPVPMEKTEGVNISLVNSDGILIRTGVKNIRVMGRDTQGVKVMRVIGDQRVLLATSIVEEGGDEGSVPDGDSDGGDFPRDTVEDNESADNQAETPTEEEDEPVDDVANELSALEDL